jgi:hypothetical protein
MVLSRPFDAKLEFARYAEPVLEHEVSVVRRPPCALVQG